MERKLPILIQMLSYLVGALGGLDDDHNSERAGNRSASRKVSGLPNHFVLLANSDHERSDL
jgi:hypothetical protein